MRCNMQGNSRLTQADTCIKGIVYYLFSSSFFGELGFVLNLFMSLCAMELSHSSVMIRQP